MKKGYAQFAITFTMKKKAILITKFLQVTFSKLSEDWVCQLCEAGKSEFQKL